MKDDKKTASVRRKKSKKKKRARRPVGLLFLLLLFLIGIGSFYGYRYLSGFSEGARHINVPPKEAKSNEPINILLMGVDIGTPGSKSQNDPKRTDTILLLNYNPETEAANIVSIPRDTLIKLKGKRQKINAAHAIGGVPYLIDAVEKLLGVEVNYYGKLDYAGFREFINAVGGVDMRIANRMDYDDTAQDLHIHFKKGEVVHLDGKKAEEYFRWRKNNDGSGLAEGDLGRIENQHLFIEKVIDKFKSPFIITKIPGILQTVPKYAETNMSPQDIVKYGYIFSKLDKSKVKMVTIKGDTAYIGGVSYFIYDEHQNTDLLSSIRGKQLQGENKTKKQNNS